MSHIQKANAYMKVVLGDQESLGLFAKCYAHKHGPNSAFGAALEIDKIMKYGAEIRVAKDTSHYEVIALEGAEEKRFERVEDLLKFSLKHWREGRYSLICRVNCKG